ncbi:dienelactone hydrolase family protein [Williamsia maris]|uniref:Dienelactone hydrolase n=1 Tax=Williamsia maris TaxID=72806 RepID=A0ABT1HJ80_9NOCA|nr:dienelactone hydrolase family protein [Williamsia maris]MCP2177992.1 Dienelactone hydrolase [Williamsia maris]
MAEVAIFHSALGIRRGIDDAAQHFRDAGHDVTVVDQYDGRSFDDYDTAGAFVADIGFPELMRRALDGVQRLSDGFVVLGFSNGGGMATHVALHRRVSRAILCSGALPLEILGADRWPDGMPVQIHYTGDDPFKTDGSVESVMRSVADAGASAEYFQYPGRGHLFTDVDQVDEFDPVATEQLWQHVDRFTS